MTERDYDRQLADLKTFAASTEFDFLLTIKDDRPNSSFKLTDFAETGYAVRNGVVKKAYHQLRIAFGLKDFKNSPSIAYKNPASEISHIILPSSSRNFIV